MQISDKNTSSSAAYRPDRPSQTPASPTLHLSAVCRWAGSSEVYSVSKVFLWNKEICVASRRLKIWQNVVIMILISDDSYFIVNDLSVFHVTSQPHLSLHVHCWSVVLLRLYLLKSCFISLGKLQPKQKLSSWFCWSSGWKLSFYRMMFQPPQIWWSRFLHLNCVLLSVVSLLSW